MSDSDYIPDEEERTVKTTTTRKATAKTSIYASDSDYSPDKVYTVKATKMRKPAKQTVLKKSNYSPDEEKYTIKATKTRKPTKSTTKEDISSDVEEYNVKATKRLKPINPTAKGSSIIFSISPTFTIRLTKIVHTLTKCVRISWSLDGR